MSPGKFGSRCNVSFKDQSGQRGVAELLQRSLQRQRLAHAYLFTGPRGSGKEAMARTLAKALNCSKREHDSCDQCDSCRRIDEESHPDVYAVRPESKSRRITADQILEFEKSIFLKPMMGRVKVGWIIDADCMNESASNKFLKTLEEPPAQTVIVLLSAEPQRLLPTILSRCLRISFGPTATRAAESPAFAKLMPQLAKFSTASEEQIANAYQFLAEVTVQLQELRAEIQRRVEEESDAENPGELDAKIRDRLEKQQEARIEGEYRGERERLLENIYSWFGDQVLCVEGASDELLAQAGQAKAVRRAAAGLTYDRALRNLEAIEKIRDSLSRNVAESFALEAGLLKIAQ